MFTIQVKPDASKHDSGKVSCLVEKYIVNETNNKLEACIVNQEALEVLKERFSTYNRVKTMKSVKKLHFEATIIDDKLLVIFTGNIRDSLFFLNEFRAISKEAYEESIAKLNSISYGISTTKISITPGTVKLNDEEPKQQSSFISIGNPTHLTSSSCLFTPAKDESITPASIFCSTELQLITTPLPSQSSCK